MSREFPDWVDPVKTASSERAFEGTVPLARLKRLVDLLADPEGEAEFLLAFSFDGQRQVRVDVRVAARVWLTCQRTLERFRTEISGESTVGIAFSERDAEAMPEDYEPLFCEDSRLRLMDLVEEELILAVPLVPRKPDTEPVRPEAGEPAERPHPFAELAALKTGRSDGGNGTN